MPLVSHMTYPSSREMDMTVSQKRIDTKISEIERDIAATERRMRAGNPYAKMELATLHNNLATLRSGRGLVGHFLFSEDR
jgi:hypothetical protein